MRYRLRPQRRVLLLGAVAGAIVACVLVGLGLASGGGDDGGGERATAAVAPQDRLATALATDLEGTPSARDVRNARTATRDLRRRMLAAHPYYRLYKAAKRRYGVSWFLVASIHYQETGFEKADPRTARRAIMAIGAALRAAGARDLGGAAARAAAARYGDDPAGRLSTAMVLERARAWKQLGAIPLPGRGELATPVAGPVGGCGYFGCPRPGHYHAGLDILAPVGTPVRAAEAGVVAVSERPGESGGYGIFVCLQHRDRLATCYAHLGAVAPGLRPGSPVARGQVIGVVGMTGRTTGPHLHFEVRRGAATCHACAVDPAPFLDGTVPQTAVPKLLADARRFARGGRSRSARARRRADRDAARLVAPDGAESSPAPRAAPRHRRAPHVPPAGPAEPFPGPAPEPAPAPRPGPPAPAPAPAPPPSTAPAEPPPATTTTPPPATTPTQPPPATTPAEPPPTTTTPAEPTPG